MARNPLELTGHQISERVTLTKGELFKVTGGPVWTDRSGTEHRAGVSGKFCLDRIIKIGSRIYFEAWQIGEGGSLGAYHILYVKGRAYRSLDGIILNRPYKVRRVRS